MISWHKVGQPVVARDCAHAVRAECVRRGFWMPPIGSKHVIVLVKADRGGAGQVVFGSIHDRADVYFKLADQPQSSTWFDANLFSPLYPQAVENLRRLAIDPPQNSDPDHAPPADQRVRETTE